MQEYISSYIKRLSKTLEFDAMTTVPVLGQAILEAWQSNKTVYFCGNGGSAGNAIHLANDLLYGAGVNNAKGIRVESLSANPAILTCLANDVGYDQIYSEQIKVKANKNDVLVILSGSGNSANVVNALEMGNKVGMKTFAILGFKGGKCKDAAQYPIHFEIDDMQIAEDLQLIIGHMCMQWLCDQRVAFEDES
jgi:D-sedoheptulose 7-phosphate isomerase